jgi:hypothetical protein
MHCTSAEPVPAAHAAKAAPASNHFKVHVSMLLCGQFAKGTAKTEYKQTLHACRELMLSQTRRWQLPAMQQLLQGLHFTQQSLR